MKIIIIPPLLILIMKLIQIMIKSKVTPRTYLKSSNHS